MSNATYYQRNKDVIEQNIIMKKIKKDWESLQKINTETYLQKIKIKRENMDIIIRLKKETKNKGKPKKLSWS